MAQGGEEEYMLCWQIRQRHGSSGEGRGRAGGDGTVIDGPSLSSQRSVGIKRGVVWMMRVDT